MRRVIDIIPNQNRPMPVFQIFISVSILLFISGAFLVSSAQERS